MCIPSAAQAASLAGFGGTAEAAPFQSGSRFDLIRGSLASTGALRRFIMLAATNTAVVSLNVNDRSSRGSIHAAGRNQSTQIEAANFLNLLIVDDDRTIREACREVAQSLGFNTQVAESAEQAYRLLDSSSTDAVLLDLRMPGASGLEALHAIKKHRADALVIVVTGYGTVKSAVQAMKDGAYDYVTKPFSMEELRLLLERVSGHLKLKTENRTLREKIKS